MTTEPPTDIAKARADLAATVGAIEDRLNLPKQARLAAKRASGRLQNLPTENPLALVALAVGVSVLVGGGVWLIVRAARK
jgi:hypothetical protein